MKLPAPSLVLALALPLLSLAACSSDSGVDGGGDGTPDAGGGDGAVVEGCKGDPDRAGAVCVESMEITLVDEEGAPIEGVTVFCCGTDICSEPVATDAEGKAHIEVGSYMVKPAFKVTGGGKYISFAAPFPEGESKVVFPPTTLIAFPEEGVAFEPGTEQSLTSNDVTLGIAADTDVFIDELSLPDEEDQLFKAVRIPLDKAPPIGRPAQGPLDAMYGFAPLSTSFDPPAKLTLPNPDPETYPAGTPIDVYVHGIEIDEAFAPYGGWGLVEAGAVVSEDGESIVTEGGIPLLSTIGIGAKKNLP